MPSCLLSRRIPLSDILIFIGSVLFIVGLLFSVFGE